MTRAQRILFGASTAGLGMVLIWMLLTASAARASTCAAQNNYTGSTGGSWSEAANWSNGVPKSTETVCIPEGKGTITVPAHFTAEAKAILSQSGLTIDGEGTLAIAEKVTTGELKVKEEHASRFADLTVDGTLSTAGAWILMSGSIVVEGEITTLATGPSRNEDTARLLGGTLVGNGTIDISFNNIAGTIEPGGPGVIGELHFTSLSAQQAAGTLVLDLKSSTEFDQLADLTSNFFFNAESTIRINLLGGYDPPVGAKWEFMSKGPGDAVETDNIEPSSFTARSVSGGAEVERISAPKGGELPPEEKTSEETPVKEPPAEVKAPTGTGTSGTTGDGSGTTSLVSSIGGALAPQQPSAPLVAVATTPRAVEELLLGCSKRSLVLNDVLIRGGRVVLNGSAAKALVGKKVKIIFDAGQQVATATVKANGQFSTSAPLPPARLRDSNSARYLAESGRQRSLNLKLTRRLSLESPSFSGGAVTLAGQVVAPLTKPIASVTVEQQLECGKASKVLTFVPPANGRFRVTIKGIPATAKAGIYRLSTSVRQNPSSHQAFPTYSLPLPVIL
jgi:hypothetical protein